MNNSEIWPIRNLEKFNYGIYLKLQSTVTQGHQGNIKSWEFWDMTAYQDTTTRPQPIGILQKALSKGLSSNTVITSVIGKILIQIMSAPARRMGDILKHREQNYQSYTRFTALSL